MIDKKEEEKHSELFEINTNYNENIKKGRTSNIVNNVVCTSKWERKINCVNPPLTV